MERNSPFTLDGKLLKGTEIENKPWKYCRTFCLYLLYLRIPDHGKQLGIVPHFYCCKTTAGLLFCYQGKLNGLIIIIRSLTTEHVIFLPSLTISLLRLRNFSDQKSEGEILAETSVLGSPWAQKSILKKVSDGLYAALKRNYPINFHKIFKKRMGFQNFQAARAGVLEILKINLLVSQKNSKNIGFIIFWRCTNSQLVLWLRHTIYRQRSVRP